MKSERKIYRSRTNEVKMEVEEKKKELNALAKYLSKRNEFINNLKSTVKENPLQFKLDERISEYLNLMFKKHEFVSNMNEEFKRFETEFERFSIIFIEKLSKRYPLLTRVELKICSMIKINLSSKEMANLLFLSTRTIEKYKYSICKKIYLKPNQNIITFLNSLDGSLPLSSF